MGRAIERLGWSWVFCSSHAFNTSLQTSLLYYNAIFQLSGLALLNRRLWMTTCDICHLDTGVNHISSCTDSVKYNAYAVRCTRYVTKIKHESSQVRRKISGMAKNNHSRIHGSNIFHLEHRKNYDLHCSCVSCSRQHHTNAKNKLSNRARLSSLYCTCCA